MFLRKLAEHQASRSPWIIAHRGCSAVAPENTLIAADAAYSAGADAWELDVQLTRDGVPVVLHDESLLRTTDLAERLPEDERTRRRGLVREFDLAEIVGLDAGRWFLADGPRSACHFGTLDHLPDAVRTEIEAGTVRVPTLKQALRWTVERGAWVNVELKPSPGTGSDLVRKTLEVIRLTRSEERVLVSSFDHTYLVEIRRAWPELAVGALTASSIEHPARYVRETLGVDTLHLAATTLGPIGHLRLDVLAELARAAIPTLVYTVNDPELARHLAGAGVAGIFTDDLQALAKAIQAAP